ncbi:hypothetical protein HDU97_010219 [Phlyctochytrium planicorne]|nr:hypothetical protein HDU97_010219 [Phlyctochytrium planicorne]
MGIFSTHLDKLDDTRLVTSHYLTPRGLRLYRGIIAFYMFAFTFVHFFYDRAQYTQYFAYFTNFSWLGLLAYFISSTYNVHVYIRNGYKADRLKSRNNFVRWLFWNVYALPAVFHYLIPLVFWVLLSEKLFKEPTVWGFVSNIHIHALTGVLTCAEVIISRVPMYYSQGTLIIVVATLFVCYSQLAHIWFSTSTENFWAYPFLDTGKKGWYLWYAGVGILFVFFFVVVVAIHKGRDRRRERLQMVVKMDPDAQYEDEESKTSKDLFRGNAKESSRQ